MRGREAGPGRRTRPRPTAEAELYGLSASLGAAGQGGAAAGTDRSTLLLRSTWDEGLEPPPVRRSRSPLGNRLPSPKGVGPVKSPTAAALQQQREKQQREDWGAEAAAEVAGTAGAFADASEEADEQGPWDDASEGEDESYAFVSVNGSEDVEEEGEGLEHGDDDDEEERRVLKAPHFDGSSESMEEGDEETDQTSAAAAAAAAANAAATAAIHGSRVSAPVATRGGGGGGGGDGTTEVHSPINRSSADRRVTEFGSGLQARQHALAVVAAAVAAADDTAEEEKSRTSGLLLAQEQQQEEQEQKRRTALEGEGEGKTRWKENGEDEEDEHKRQQGQPAIEEMEVQWWSPDGATYTVMEKLLQQYRHKVEQHETDRVGIIARLKDIEVNQAELQSQRWAIQEKDEAIVALKDRVDDLEGEVYRSMTSNIALTGLLERSRADVASCNRRINMLTDMTQHVQQEVKFVRDCRPSSVVSQRLKGPISPRGNTNGVGPHQHSTQGETGGGGGGGGDNNPAEPSTMYKSEEPLSQSHGMATNGGGGGMAANGGGAMAVNGGGVERGGQGIGISAPPPSSSSSSSSLFPKSSGAMVAKPSVRRSSTMMMSSPTHAHTHRGAFPSSGQEQQQHHNQHDQQDHHHQQQQSYGQQQQQQQQQQGGYASSVTSSQRSQSSHRRRKRRPADQQLVIQQQQQVVRLVYLPSERTDQLMALTTALQKQLKDQEDLSKARQLELIQSRSSMERSLRDQVGRATEKLNLYVEATQALETKLSALTKDYLLQAQAQQRLERQLSESELKHSQRLMVVKKECEQSLREMSARNASQHQGNLALAAALEVKEGRIQMLNDQSRESKQLYEKRAKDLSKQLLSARSKLKAEQRRRLLDTEGYMRDVHALKAAVRGMEATHAPAHAHTHVHTGWTTLRAGAGAGAPVGDAASAARPPPPPPGRRDSGSIGSRDRGQRQQQRSRGGVMGGGSYDEEEEDEYDDDESDDDDDDDNDDDEEEEERRRQQQQQQHPFARSEQLEREVSELKYRLSVLKGGAAEGASKGARGRASTAATAGPGYGPAAAPSKVAGKGRRKNVDGGRGAAAVGDTAVCRGTSSLRGARPMQQSRLAVHQQQQLVIQQQQQQQQQWTEGRRTRVGDRRAATAAAAGAAVGDTRGAFAGAGYYSSPSRRGGGGGGGQVGKARRRTSS